LLNKGKSSRRALVAILAITAVSLWVFSLHPQTRETGKKDKNKKTLLDQIRKISQAERNKKEIPGETGKTPQTGKSQREIPREIRETPPTEKSPGEVPREIPGEIKKAPKSEKMKKEIPAEIINISKLDKIAREFSINRDIFSPDLMKPAAPAPDIGKQQFTPQPPPLPEEEKRVLPSVDPKAVIEKDLQGLSYEGFVIKESKSCALISMNSEFYAVIVGDIILEKIKIIKIDRNTITVEVESYEFEIQIKEDEQNEIQ
jgi:hypothetical protein